MEIMSLRPGFIRVVKRNNNNKLYNRLNGFIIFISITGILISKIEGKYWTAVFTYRGKKIRIISVRRARKNEKEIYES